MEINNICGIYKIQNKINGKIYIGKSTYIKVRWKLYYNHGTKKDQPILQAIDKYGIENFDFSVIENCLPKDLNEREQYWIKYYNSYEEGYNATLGGDGTLFYDYEAIHNDWVKGYSTKNIRERFKCDEGVIHKALMAYGVSQTEILVRSQAEKSHPIVAIEPSTLTVIKSFPSISYTTKFINKPRTSSTLSKVAKSFSSLNRKIYFGFYWDFLNENNIPQIEMDDETFLELLEERTFHNMSSEGKQKLSTLNRKIERPSREEFKKLIREESFASLGRKYDVHPSTISRWCVDYNLPSLKREINSLNDEEWELI
jgi:group I intron endonuclease